MIRLWECSQKMEYRNIMTYGIDRTKSVINTSFKLIKNIRFNNDREMQEMIHKLDLLKTEKFNRVLIPDFNYSIRDNFLIYNVV